MSDDGPRVLILDIETMPAKTEQFRMDDYTTIDRIVTPGYVFGFGYMWHNNASTTMENYKPGPIQWVQENIAEASYDLLCEADIVVTWNGDKFDIPHLNTEMAKKNLTWPSSSKSVDVYRTVRRRLALESNKLDYSARIFLGEQKIKTDYSLWQGCMAGDELSIRKMARYCRRDVKLTDQLYVKFLSLVKNHPNVGLWLSGRCCPACGSPAVQKRGVERLVSMTYQRWWCVDCGKWSRSARGERIEAELRPA